MEPPADVMAGQAIYNQATLAAYDVGVLGLSCRLLWRCPKAEMLAAYDRNVGVRHLDLGVGTAYFLDKCQFPNARPQVTLVDLNPTVLKVAARRISRYRPETIQANVLQPLPIPPGAYDSVGRSSKYQRSGARNRPDLAGTGANIVVSGPEHRAGRRLVGEALRDAVTVQPSAIWTPQYSQAAYSGWRVFMSSNSSTIRSRYQALAHCRITMPDTTVSRSSTTSP